MKRLEEIAWREEGLGAGETLSESWGETGHMYLKRRPSHG